ncbi:MAG: hypothetical protein ACTSRH_08420 [Promethearchaeota archaeon]
MEEYHCKGRSQAYDYPIRGSSNIQDKISYKRCDYKFTVVNNKLHSRYFIKSDKEWEKALKISKIFISFCSENSIKSRVVQDEWEPAFQLRKKD